MDPTNFILSKVMHDLHQSSDMQHETKTTINSKIAHKPSSTKACLSREEAKTCILHVFNNRPVIDGHKAALLGMEKNFICDLIRYVAWVLTKADVLEHAQTCHQYFSSHDDFSDMLLADQDVENTDTARMDVTKASYKANIEFLESVADRMNCSTSFELHWNPLDISGVSVFPEAIMFCNSTTFLSFAGTNDCSPRFH